jgi:hypothetical protein
MNSHPISRWRFTTKTLTPLMTSPPCCPCQLTCPNFCRSRWPQVPMIREKKHGGSVLHTSSVTLQTRCLQGNATNKQPCKDQRKQISFLEVQYWIQRRGNGASFPERLHESVTESGTVHILTKNRAVGLTNHPPFCQSQPPCVNV